MSYSDFTLRGVQEAFRLEIIENSGLFSKLEELIPSEFFLATLEENIPLAVSIHTEKARSELIISNVLVEIRKQFDRKISFFSGVEFSVDKEKGLSGYCDFIISLSPEQLFVRTPVVFLVEAKNENTVGGLGQCIAEMIAASLFNQEQRTIYGAVTTGTAWRFLKLQKNAVYIDLRDYYLEEKPGKILGILSSMLKQVA
ncbi:conserved hypothetical protein [Gammaproteobacteria bacterium]